MNGESEVTPAQVGVSPAGLATVLGLIQEREAAAQLCVMREGQVVLDRAFGCRRDDLFLVFSAGKPLLAMLVHLLAERGALMLDAPVSRYWPRFGRHGKDAVTIRQVLQHRAGVPVARSLLRDALVATDWGRSIRMIEDARPTWPPGLVPAYHVISFGFILGEVVQRVTGTDVQSALRTELLDPLGLTDTYVGLPDAQWRRRVPVHGGGAGARLRASVFNRRRVRQAVIPAATVSSTARDLAGFYQLLLDDGQTGRTRLLTPATVRTARQASSDGEVDRYLRLPIRWSQGFQLGGPGPGAGPAPGPGAGPGAGPAPAPGAGASAGPPRPMGRRSGRDTFGHNGSNCCLAWADPHRRVVLAYLTNRLEPGLEGSPHLSDVSDAVLDACR